MTVVSERTVRTVLFLLLFYIMAAPGCVPTATAASFDCSKVETRVEKMVCSDARISALDDELSRVYKEALGLASDKAAFKSAQKDWLGKVRNRAAGSADSLYAEYLARIEEIRLDPALRKSLFAGKPPTASILGRYSTTEPLCFHPRGGDEYDCPGEPVESYIDIKAGPGNGVTVTGEIWFFNGHVCGPFGGKAEWAGDSLRMPNLEDDEDRCVLIMRFKDGRVFTEDPGSFCKGALLCGANAGFHNVELPKQAR